MKVLLADTDPARADAVADRLTDMGVDDIVRLAPGEDLVAAVKAAAPDVIVVDMARPDRDALEGIKQVTARDPRPIVMFVDRDDPEFMEQAVAAGVSSYNVVGRALPDVKPIVEAAVAMFRRYQKLNTALNDTVVELDAQRVVHRAKLVLMHERGINEGQAYRWLRKRAMDSGRRIADVAADVVAKTGTPS